MGPISDSAQLSHPWLREFAVVAAWIATRAESAHEVEVCLVALPPEDRVLPDSSTPWL
jgi:hypothetical protein